MNVLSLFDGISVGQLALSNLGIKIDNYFASEIDKYAIAITKHNFPNTKHIGDVTEINPFDLPKIDLLIGGSPCTNFSFSGKRQGMVTKDNIKILTLDQYLDLKEKGFEFDGQSYLFWEYVRLLRSTKPKYFFLENVVMTKDWESILSEQVGITPTLINSSLVTAQNRRRLYWIGKLNEETMLYEKVGLPQPEDCGILLRDIIENGYVDRDKSYCIDASYYKGGNLRQYYEKSRRQLVFTGGAMRGRYLPDGSIEQRIEIRDDEKSNCLTTVQKDTLCIQIGEDDITYRNLTPLECERLQSLPEEFTALGLFETKNGLTTKAVSNSQRYKCIGNSWTEKVIRHNFSFLLETSE